MKYNAHALGNYHGYTMTNSKEALLNSYKTGFRFFEVDIQRTSDGHFVAYHLWSKNDAERLEIPFDEQNPVPDLKTFCSYRYLTGRFKGGLSPLTIDDIFDFMRARRDVTVMFDFLAGYVDRDNPELMKQLADTFAQNPDIADRSTVETYSLKNARALYGAGFPHIQPWIDLPENSEPGFQNIKDIMAFLKTHNLKNVSMSPERIIRNPAEISELKTLGVRIFSPGWNTSKSLKEANRIGIDIATTDLPMRTMSLKLLKMRYRLLSHLTCGQKAKKYRAKYKKIDYIRKGNYKNHSSTSPSSPPPPFCVHENNRTEQFRINKNSVEIFYKKYFSLQLYENTIETLVIGSSHGFYGYMAEKSHYELNACDPSQDLYYSYKIYDKYSNAPKLKNIVLFYSVFLPGYLTELSPEEWRCDLYKFFFDIPYRFTTEYEKRPILDYLASLTADIKTAPHDFQYTGNCPHTAFNAPDINAKARAEAHLKGALRDENQDFYLELMAELANKKGHNLYVVLPPYRSDYTSFLPSFAETFSPLLKLKNINVISFFSDDRFLDSDFGDTDHLNENGARKLTELIRKKINE